MTFSKGTYSVSLSDILDKVSEADILSYYLGITTIPCIIKSPLRKDNKPSFGLYTRDGKKVFFVDFSTRERGNTFTLLEKMWNCNYEEALTRINRDFSRFCKKLSINKSNPSNVVKATSISNNSTELQCKVREWKDYDIEYWASYGISLKWLKYAEVYPISHKIVVKNNRKYVFKADKYAYAYVEHKEGKITLKIYQPFNRVGYKWSNKHDNSVVSLWTKVPEKGERICICSSMKDALCLWANTGIPALAIQGEGYGMSNTAINELKRRFNKVFILLDNDKAGLEDGIKLAESTGFINLVLPNIEGNKDVSDLYKYLNDKKEFKRIILDLFKEKDCLG